MLLSALHPGASARVRSVSAESDAVLRLREMGLHNGVTIRLDLIATGGACIVTVGAARLAIDRATAALIDLDLP